MVRGSWPCGPIATDMQDPSGPAQPVLSAGEGAAHLLLATSFMLAGPSSSGKPWPRFTDLCSTAKALITENMVVGRAAIAG